MIFLPSISYYKEDIENKYDTKKEKRRKNYPPVSKEGSGTIQFMITNRMRRNLENELNYLTEEVDVMDPQIASVVIEKRLSRPSSGMPKSWIRKQQEIPFMEQQMTRLKNSILKLTDFTIHKIFPVAISAYAVFYILPNVVRSLFTKTTAIFKSDKSFKSPKKVGATKNSKSFDLKGIFNKKSKLQNVDMKNMNKIFGR